MNAHFAHAPVIDVALTGWVAQTIELSALWVTGGLSKQAAVDASWQAAIDAGLVDVEGADEIQRSLALAFDPDAWPHLRVVDPAPVLSPESKPSSRPTPQTTIEAVMYSVRQRGLAALHEPATIERLGRCDEAARQQINERIEKLGIAAPGERARHD